MAKIIVTVVCLALVSSVGKSQVLDVEEEEVKPAKRASTTAATTKSTTTAPTTVTSVTTASSRAAEKRTVPTVVPASPTAVKTAAPASPTAVITATRKFLETLRSNMAPFVTSTRTTTGSAMPSTAQRSASDQVSHNNTVTEKTLPERGSKIDGRYSSGYSRGSRHQFNNIFDLMNPASNQGFLYQNTDDSMYKHQDTQQDLQYLLYYWMFS